MQITTRIKEIMDRILDMDLFEMLLWFGIIMAIMLLIDHGGRP